MCKSTWALKGSVNLLPLSFSTTKILFFIKGLKTFSVDFCFGYPECPPYFYFWSNWLTDLESVSRVSPLMTKIFTKFEVDKTTCCFCWYIMGPCDLDLWPFDLGQWLCMAGHTINPSTKFEDPMAIPSWVMSSDISHRIPLTVHLQPLRMHRITWLTYA